MTHRNPSCKCFSCPDCDTAACPKLQAENQVRDLLLERKVLRNTLAGIKPQNTKCTNEADANKIIDLRSAIVRVRAASEQYLAKEDSELLKIALSLLAKEANV